MSLDFIADALDGDGNVDQGNIDRFDLNHDGQITAADNPFPNGSAEAKLWWKNVIDPHTHANISPELKAKYGEKIVGVYAGKALVPGEAGANQGDFQYLVDKLQVTQGLSYGSAMKIAAKIKHMLYG